MKSVTFQDYQDKIEGKLLRHRSILDILTKNQDAAARVNRAIAKAVTGCGCIEMHAKKQEIPEDGSLDNLGSYMDTHLTGSLCPRCKTILEDELGNQLFYMTSLANVLGLDLDEIILQEERKMSALGKYHLR